MKSRTHFFAMLWLIAGILLFSRSAYAGSGSLPCSANMAAGFPCENVDLLAQLDLSELGAVDGTIKGSDHWGWQDSVTGRDFVIFGLTDSTAFVEITDRQNPVYLGTLPGRDGASTWRDIKVYQDSAYITADIPTNHGLQVFDLTQLRTVISPPVTFTETFHYAGFGPGHNLWVNENAGTLYLFRSDQCSGGVLTFDLSNPNQPTNTGCFAETDVPLSDAECVIYSGPDGAYSGQELCFVGSDDNMTIYDVTDKNAVSLLSDFDYAGIARAHQGSLTADMRYWIMTDTMDEFNFGHNTRTHVFDVLDIDNPVYLGYYEHDSTARDHNAYIIDNVMYQTNWMSGLRIFDISGLPETNFTLLGKFDIEPSSDSIATEGAWSSYPWWDDGVVTVSGTQNGLFILEPTNVNVPTSVSLSGFDGEGMLAWGWGIAGIFLLLTFTFHWIHQQKTEA